jgi:23S rRNA (cytidine1920-2'-O)/16S rRNA (cytidine1409-2'-O)-methyltransferase
MSGRVRLDQALVARGLFASRARAQAAIAAGLVTVDGAAADKPGQLVAGDAVLAAQEPWPWVSRAGVKLAAALDAFGVDPAGLGCLDIGASTGGFTDVLLARGAAHVTAVDVGHGQLDPRLAADPRVRSLEGLDARSLTAADLPGPPDLIVCDASFISLVKLLPAPLALAPPAAILIALVKPQFEAGRTRIGRGGKVADDVAAQVAAETAAALDGMAGFAVRALIDSPIRGGEGAREFLLLAGRSQ